MPGIGISGEDSSTASDAGRGAVTRLAFIRCAVDFHQHGVINLAPEGILYGHYSPRSRPLRWGKYVMMFVYDAVDGDVGKELRKKNPDPHFLQNHHQWLKKFGREKVHDQITAVVTIMKLCENMDDFRQKFARLFKKSSPQMEFTFAP